MKKLSLALVAVGSMFALTAGSASAAIVCNEDSDCWRTKTRYDYKPELPRFIVSVDHKGLPCQGPARIIPDAGEKRPADVSPSIRGVFVSSADHGGTVPMTRGWQRKRHCEGAIKDRVAMALVMA